MMIADGGVLLVLANRIRVVLFGVALLQSSAACAPAPSSSADPDAGRPDAAAPADGSGAEARDGARAPRVLFLNLDGVTITSGATSDSAHNRSQICSGSFPAFDHTPYGTRRSQVIADLLRRLRGLLGEFAVQLRTTRPASGRYLMLVLGGLPGACGYGSGIGGLAPQDCGDQQRGEVAFIFSAGITHPQMLAVTIAHEAAHTLGLVHTSDGCDVMSPVICGAGDKRFLDRLMAVWPDHLGLCGLKQANSWKMMLEALGAAGAPATMTLSRPAAGAAPRGVACPLAQRE
jgi:hypothetical protein